MSEKISIFGFDASWDEIEWLDCDWGEWDDMDESQLLKKFLMRMRETGNVPVNIHFARAGIDKALDKLSSLSNENGKLTSQVQELQNTLDEERADRAITESKRASEDKIAARKNRIQFWVSIAATVIMTFVGYLLGRLC